MNFDNHTYKISNSASWGRGAILIGAVGAVAAVAGYFLDSRQFFHSYLVAYIFWLTLALGGLFFTMLHHLVGATWSVVMRRLAEAVMIMLPLMAVLFIPIALGLHHLYHWSHHDLVAADEMLQKKQPYLNSTFFFIRAAIYFLVWFLLARSLYRASLRQDGRLSEVDQKRMRWVSAPGMVIFAVSLTFASFDWLMSLDAHWYSTIFGAYVFAGAVMAALAFITLAALALRSQGVLVQEITVEHYHDLAKLTFAFVIFWAYMAFSQYMLIWYANIPEETIWFEHRWHGSWKIVSLIIVFGHFVVPFFVLVTRAAKRNFGALRFISVWLLLMHWVDIYWLVMPSHDQQAVSVSWMDAAAMLLVGGVSFWYFWLRLSSQPLLPVSDPKLPESIRFINP